MGLQACDVEIAEIYTRAWGNQGFNTLQVSETACGRCSSTKKRNFTHHEEQRHAQHDDIASARASPNRVLTSLCSSGASRPNASNRSAALGPRKV